MKISISEARRRLPELVRRVRMDPDTQVLIMVHNEVVAELRAPQVEPAPGAAVKKLQDVIRRMPKRSRRKVDISSHVDRHLYENPKKRRG